MGEGLYPPSLGRKLWEVLVKGRRPADAVAGGFTCAFEKLLVEWAASEDRHGGELIKLIDLSRDCVIASSPLLRGNMAWVNRRLVRPGAFMAPCLVSRSVISANRSRVATF